MILIALMMIMMGGNENVLFDFTNEASLQRWYVVDDVVMGGRSSGSFRLNDDGNAVFSGTVSLENNGGFSSVRYVPNEYPENKISEFVIRLKGDGKDYQFRAKSSRNDRHSYIGEFSTTGDWQTVVINCADMYPAFRGRTLNMDNYSGDDLQEIAFLIGNKKNESFLLEIDKISLR